MIHSGTCQLLLSMPDAALTSFLASAKLSHLNELLGAETLDRLDAKLDSDGRTGFLNHLKALGLTALKDRQGLANAVAKAKRERANVGGATAPPMDMPTDAKFTGPVLEYDVFGTMRGASKSAGVCQQFGRIQGKNENDMRAFTCVHCGKPADQHIDLGPKPFDEADAGVDFDVRQLAVDGRAAFSQHAAGADGSAVPESHMVSEAHLELFAAGSDPLAAAMPSPAMDNGAGPHADPLGLGQMSTGSAGASSMMTAVDDPLGLAQMSSDSPTPLPPPPTAPPIAPPVAPPTAALTAAVASSGASGSDAPAPLAVEAAPLAVEAAPLAVEAAPLAVKADPLAAVRQKGLDVGALEALAVEDRKAVTVALTAAGFKTGPRMRIEAILLQRAAAGSSRAPTAGGCGAVGMVAAYQVDFFGVKRGKSTRPAASCTRYEARVTQVNHCCGPSDASLLNCVRCLGAPSEHEDLGAWEPNEPMLVTEAGQRFRSLQIS